MDLENESARMGLEFRAPGFGMSSQGIVSTSYSLADCWVHVVSTRAFLTVLIQFEKLTSGACAGSGLGLGFRVSRLAFMFPTWCIGWWAQAISCCEKAGH